MYKFSWNCFPSRPLRKARGRGLGNLIQSFYQSFFHFFHFENNAQPIASSFSSTNKKNTTNIRSTGKRWHFPVTTVKQLPNSTVSAPLYGQYYPAIAWQLSAFPKQDFFGSFALRYTNFARVRRVGHFFSR